MFDLNNTMCSTRLVSGEQCTAHDTVSLAVGIARNMQAQVGGPSFVREEYGRRNTHFKPSLSTANIH